MILSAQSICKLIKIEPFEERSVHKETGMSYGLSSAGYDVTIDQDVTLYPFYSLLYVPIKRGILKLLNKEYKHVKCGFSLASIQQYIEIPDNMIATVNDKSTLARQGLAVQNTVAEPGWNGYLTIELSNHGLKTVRLKKGQPIAQIMFELLDFPTEQPYNGKYQNQPNRPVGAIKEKCTQ